MPTVALKRNDLFKALDREFTDAEFEELCFEFGLELDEITTEKELVMKEQGETAATDHMSDEVLYKIDVPANRYDLLCVEGLVRALRVFKNQIPVPKYRKIVPSSPIKLHVTQATQSVRPFVVAAVLRNVTLNAQRYASFIDLQDKLHHNICRKRTLASIGTHDLDTLTPPFTYDAKLPKDIKFRALNQNVEMTATQLMEMYSKDSHLRYFVPIILDKERYPIIYDKNGTVLSLPPIINSDHSKIRLETKNIFVEITATDLHKASIVLDTMVTMFSEYCSDKFSVETVDIINWDSTQSTYPELAQRTERVSTSYLHKETSLDLPAEEVAQLLSRMCLTSEVDKDWQAGEKYLQVHIPPTRHDVLHPCDIVEDLAIVYGYDNLPNKLPVTDCVAAQYPINKLTDQVRLELAMATLTEGLTFTLCCKEDISENLRQPLEVLNSAVHISNPKSAEFQVVRTTLLPGLLRTIAHNRKMPLPIKLFEVRDVVLKDSSSTVGSRNRRHVCVVYCDKESAFEVVHGLLDRLMQVLDVPMSRYRLKESNDPTYLPGRCVDIVVQGLDQQDPTSSIEIGKMGVLHPEVIRNFGLKMPCTALEFNLRHFL